MHASPKSRLHRLLQWLELAQVVDFLLLPRHLYFLAWMAAAGVAIGTYLNGYFAFRLRERPDGNEGHVQVDFGGQWLLARLLVEGQGRQLYHRNYQREVMRAHYPVADQAPGARENDADKFMNWLMGDDDPQSARVIASFLSPLAARGEWECTALLAAGQSHWTEERVLLAAARPIGGPLYPPIHPLIHYPIGLLSPRAGYRAMQIVALVLSIAAAGGISILSRGRIWWPVSACALMLYPGCAAAVNLGQNPVLTLTILVWGWVLLARGRDAGGGLVWGMLAYKPVWATAFILVLIWSRRWRACLAMLAGGAGLALLTLPLVGVQTWFDWLAVGREAALLYNVDENWIKSSRDLLSIPRRYLIDFSIPYRQRDKNWLPPAAIGWVMLLAVGEITTRIAVLRRSSARAGEGPAAAFLLLAAWLLCFHFMYYDVLLTVLPVLLLFVDWRLYLVPRLLTLFPSARTLPWGQRCYFEARRACTIPPPVSLLMRDRPRVWVRNRLAPTLVLGVYLSMYIPGAFGILADGIPPIDTYCLLGLWLWCGWEWLQEG